MIGTITTVDGLFMSIIMLALSGILFLNVFLEARKKFAPKPAQEGAAGAENELTWPPRLPPFRRTPPPQDRSYPARIHSLVAGIGPLLSAARARCRSDRVATAFLGGHWLRLWQLVPFRRCRRQQHYLDYFYPGALIMIVLFTSIFTMMSVIEDRKEGFLLSVLVAPVPRAAIVLGKVLGGTTLSAIQGLIFLAFAPLVGIHLGVTDFLMVVLTVFLVSFALTALGFTIAWSMDSTQAFHAIINLFLIPLWLLSGALFPLAGASGWIRFLIRINPLTYGVEALA